MISFSAINLQLYGVNRRLVAANGEKIRFGIVNDLFSSFCSQVLISSLFGSRLSPIMNVDEILTMNVNRLQAYTND